MLTLSAGKPMTSFKLVKFFSLEVKLMHPEFNTEEIKNITLSKQVLLHFQIIVFEGFGLVKTITFGIQAEV